MKIKESDLLKQLATDSGKTAKRVSEIVVSELLKNKVVEDDLDNWGVSVSDAIKRRCDRGTNSQLLCGDFRGVGRVSGTGIFHCPGFGFNG